MVATLPWQRYPTNGVTPLRPRTLHVYSRIETTDPVVFLTIDDGFVRDPRVPALLAERGAPATLFLVSGSAVADPAYFGQFLTLGGSINGHTGQHAYLPGMALAEQQRQICAAMGAIRHTYGSVGSYFRPPRGESDANTYTAARACGVRAVLFWRVVASESRITRWGSAQIQPGDIILLHFRPSTYDTLLVLFAELDRLGLTAARLEDYLPT